MQCLCFWRCQFFTDYQDLRYVSGLGKVDNRICMVLEWTLGLPTPGSIFSAAASMISLHLKGTWETQNHQAFCVSLVLVSFTLIYRAAACPLLVKHPTINLSLTSEESLTDSKLPDTEDQRTVVSV